MVMKDVAIVTVRNSSTRLPNKAIMEINENVRSIDIVVKRAKKTGLPVIIATSVDSRDDIFVEISKEHDIGIFRGSLLNKIKRWNDYFKEFDIDNALLVDGDDLSYDYDIAQRAMRQLKSSKSVDLIKSPSETVCGFFTYAITKQGINKLFSIASDNEQNTDVITRYIELAELSSENISLLSHEKNKNFRLTLDYKEDLEFFQKLYKKIEFDASGEHIVEYLSKNKSIPSINFHRQKEFLLNQAKFNEMIK